MVAILRRILNCASKDVYWDTKSFKNASETEKIVPTSFVVLSFFWDQKSLSTEQFDYTMFFCSKARQILFWECELEHILGVSANQIIFSD